MFNHHSSDLFVCLHGYLRLVHFMGQRRRDVFKDDLTALGIRDGCWHQKALDRSRWMYMESVFM